jgi:hypothetical protein
MDQALEAENGIRLTYPTPELAWNRRMMFYQIRDKDRKINQDRGRGYVSPYDDLAFHLDGCVLTIAKGDPAEPEIEEF